MKLRPFAIYDAPIILSWIKDKSAFRKWSADRYPFYPPKPEDMLAQYDSDTVYPYTAINDDGNVVGHIMLRYPDPSKTVIRLGFVIVDDQLRGKGYGKQMLQLAIQKAKQEYGAKKITLGVFDNNPSAFLCYESVGFKVIGTDSYFIDGEEWMGKEMVLFYTYSYLTLRDKPELKDEAAEWFSSRWSVSKEAYLDCMDAYLNHQTDLGWYLCLDDDRIIGGLGTIENDFHDRKDLSPNICAVYTEKEYRNQGIAGRLLNMAVDDLKTKGITPVYLVTNHDGFYERYGWEFLCMVQGDGETYQSRLYLHN